MKDGNYQKHPNTICATKDAHWIFMQKVRMVLTETSRGEKLWTIEGGKEAWEKLIGSAKEVDRAQAAPATAQADVASDEVEVVNTEPTLGRNPPDATAATGLRRGKRKRKPTRFEHYETDEAVLTHM